jgi:hypothetical protein
VSLIPRNFAELISDAWHRRVAIGFTLLFLVWFNQYKFFRRYGLRIIPASCSTACCSSSFCLRLPTKISLPLLVNIFSGGGEMMRLPDGTIRTGG